MKFYSFSITVLRQVFIYSYTGGNIVRSIFMIRNWWPFRSLLRYLLVVTFEFGFHFSSLKYKVILRILEVLGVLQR